MEPGDTPGTCWRLIAGSIVFGLHPKSFTEIELSADWIVNQKFAGTLAFNSAVVNQIRPIHNL
jgi:hypothetical protein